MPQKWTKFLYFIHNKDMDCKIVKVYLQLFAYSYPL